MAATIKRELDIDAKLIEGEKGIFEIRADDDIVFARQRGEGFPDEMMVVDRVRANGG